MGNFNRKITKNFSLIEFQCKCGCKMPQDVEANIMRLIGFLQIIRDQLGKPMSILSGYRCPAHNERVGGVPNSQHLYGRAADIASRPAGFDSGYNFYQWIENNYSPGGLGGYSTFTHIDIRPGYARWTE